MRNVHRLSGRDSKVGSVSEKSLVNSEYSVRKEKRVTEASGGRLQNLRSSGFP